MVQGSFQNPSSLSVDDAELVERQLATILASSHFKSARQMQNFLQYIVHKTLAGKGNTLKQYTIAVEALGFPVDFDPDTNPVVRIKAGRVRERLARYYEYEGKSDTLVITMPKGNYTPIFERKLQANISSVKKHTLSNRPKLAVMCFSDETQDKESNRLLFQITDTLAKELSHFLFSMLVVSIPHADKSNTRFAALEIREKFQADYMLAFYMQQLPQNNYQLVCRLAHTETEEILWSECYQIKSSQPFNEQRSIIGKITAIVADIQQGILQRHWARSLLEDESSIPSRYKTLAYYRYYIDDLGRDSFIKAVNVCKEGLELDRKDVISSIILATYCRRDYVYGYDVIESPLELGEECAQNAVRLRPDSHEAHFALGQILFYLNERKRCLGEFNIARDISQFDAFVEYGVGFHFCLMGYWEEGLALVKNVMSLSTSYPSWFNMAPFLNHYFHKEYDDALSYALKVDVPHLFQGSMSRCAVYGQLGEKDKAQKELKKLLKDYPNFMTEGKQLLTRFLGSKELANGLWDGICKAKV